MPKPTLKPFFEWPKALTKQQALECDFFHKDSLRWHDSYGRLGEILGSDLSPDLFYACLGRGWTSCDNIADFQTILAEKLARATRKQLNLMMTDGEFAEWNLLPATITAYRFGYDNNLRGFSYSLKKSVAEFFSVSQRYIQAGNTKKFIVTVSIPKELTVLKLDREEDEIC